MPACSRSRLRLFAAAALLLAGWGGDIVNPNVPPQGSSNSFQLGYRQGCVTGYRDAGRDGFQALYVKDERLYAGDQDYRAGWDAGHKSCYEYESDHPHAGGIRP